MSKKTKTEYRYFVRDNIEVVKKPVYGECKLHGGKRVMLSPTAAEPSYYNSEPAKLAHKTPDAAVRALNKKLNACITRDLKRLEKMRDRRNALIEKAVTKFKLNLDYRDLPTV